MQVDPRELHYFITSWSVEDTYIESMKYVHNGCSFNLAIRNNNFDELFHAATGFGYRWDSAHKGSLINGWRNMMRKEGEEIYAS